MRNGRMRRIVELYEQGASKERVGAYLRRWLGWAGTTCCWASVVLSIGCAYVVKMHDMNDIRCNDVSILKYAEHPIARIHYIDNYEIRVIGGSDYLSGIELLPGEHSIIYKFNFGERSIVGQTVRGRHEIKYNFIAGKIYLFDSKYEYENNEDKLGGFITNTYVNIKYDRECIDDKDIRKDVTEKRIVK